MFVKVVSNITEESGSPKDTNPGEEFTFTSLNHIEGEYVVISIKGYNNVGRICKILSVEYNRYTYWYTYKATPIEALDD